MIKPAVLMLIRRNRARRSAQLDLTFTEGDTLDPRITFTRASSGTHFDSTGRLVVDADNVARFDYDPATPAGTVGAELNTSGTWSLNNAASFTANSFDSFTVNTNASGNTPAFKGFPVTAGKTYQITGFVSGSSLQTNFQISDEPWSNIVQGASVVSGLMSATFRAGSSTMRVGVNHTNAVDAFTVYNISVREVTFAPRGLLIEEARTNLLLHSRDMTQAAWSKTDVTTNRNQVGIDGAANTACLVTEGVAGTAACGQVGAAVTAGSTIAPSVVIKRGNTDWVFFRAADNTGGNGGTAWFNLATGAKGAVQNLGTGTGSTSTITNLGGGFYRLQVSTVPSGAYTLPFMMFGSATADASGTRVANATYIVDAAQLEVGAFATSIITTGAATATRAADSASMTGTNFSSWYNASEGSYVVDFSVGNTSSTAKVVDGTAPAGRLAIVSSPTTFIADKNATGYLAQYSYSRIANIPFKGAVAYSSAGVLSVANGGTPVTNATTVVASSNITIGSTGSVEYLNGHIRSIRYYNTRLPDATLRSLTT